MQPSERPPRQDVTTALQETRSALAGNGYSPVLAPGDRDVTDGTGGSASVQLWERSDDGHQVALIQCRNPARTLRAFTVLDLLVTVTTSRAEFQTGTGRRGRLVSQLRFLRSDRWPG